MATITELNSSSRTENTVIEIQITEMRTAEGRMAYKGPTSNAFQIREYSAGREPRATTLVQHERKHGNIFEVHLLLPERVHDRLFVKRLCGSKRAAENMYDTCTIRYLIDYIVLCFMTILPVNALATVAYTMSIEEALPPWFPYLGAIFYIVGVPTIVLGIILEAGLYKFVSNVDDKVLRIAISAIAFLCGICSPVYGMLAVSNITENAAVDEDMGLYVGAYFGVALYLPFWLVAVVYADNSVRYSIHSYTLLLLLKVIAFVSLTSILVGSVVHQTIVGKLVWFPYLGAIALFFIVPILSSLLVGYVLNKIWERYFFSESFQNVATLMLMLYFFVITDIFSWMLAERNFSQPVEILIQDQFLFVGAVLFYVIAVSLWIMMCAYSILQLYNNRS